MEFALLNRLTAKPGQRARVVEILLESGSCSTTTPHVVCFSLPNPRMTPT